MSKDHGGWKFAAKIIALAGVVVLLVSVFGCAAPITPSAATATEHALAIGKVARADPFYRGAFDGLVTCDSEDVYCRTGLTPDEVVEILKRQPDGVNLYEQLDAGISGVVYTYIDSFGYATVFLFRRHGPASSKAVPHLFYMSTNMPTVLERPRVR